ncbi:MAG: hypothetical protein DME25_19160 [Verrucomicrobia bacterium]|nr:MAG: hypothetical protein DME25_19160 [Verrucomicrobiota bacterium]
MIWLRGLVLAASLPWLFAGCLRSPFVNQAAVPSYKPANVYREEAFLPPSIKRVAVLPLTTLTDEATMDFGRDALGPVLFDELGRSRLFELVEVSPDELRLLTGRSTWSGEEALPLDFFEKLRDKLGVDAVLFSRLTQYRAYEPLAVGWRLKLLEADEPHILWAVDEVFDARLPEVAVAARRYAQRHPEAGSLLYGPQGVLVSPRRFGQYTASAVMETLPGRRPAAP